MQFDRREKVPSLCRQRERLFFQRFLKTKKFRRLHNFLAIPYALYWVNPGVSLHFPLLQNEGKNETPKWKFLIFIQIHNATTSYLCTLPSEFSVSLHSPLSQNEGQKRQLPKKFLSPPYRTKQGGKTKHLLKNLHFLQKVGAGFLLWVAIFLTPLSHKIGVKTEILFENFSRIFQAAKMPGANA